MGAIGAKIHKRRGLFKTLFVGGLMQKGDSKCNWKKATWGLVCLNDLGKFE